MVHADRLLLDSRAAALLMPLQDDLAFAAANVNKAPVWK